MKFLVERGDQFLFSSYETQTLIAQIYVEPSAQLLIEFTFQDSFKESLEVGFSSYCQLQALK